MNERILSPQLLKLVQAAGPGYSQANPEWVKKFAELIVLEMCGMMGQTEDDLYSLEPSERPTEYIEWLRSWQERFTKHFGVEE